MNLTSFSTLFHTLGMSIARKTTSTREEDSRNYRELLISCSFILFYYKVYPIQSAMGAIFGMSQSQVCTWIHALSPVLKSALGIEKCLPARNPRKLKEALEACALHDFLIDGTERERQRPSDPSEQKDFYSGKQKAHTYNNIVIVDEHEQTVEYLSQTYEGTYHDKAICDEEQYAFPENSTLQKDRGFQGYEPENVITYQPKKSHGMARSRSEINS